MASNLPLDAFRPQLATRPTHRYNHASMRIQVCLLLILLSLTIACSDATPTPFVTAETTIAVTLKPTDEPEQTATSRPPTDTPEPTATPSPTHTPTATPTPTPIPPQLVVSNQQIGEDGLLVIDRVVVPERSWLSVSSADAYLTTQRIDAGDNKNVQLNVEPLTVGDEITFALHEYGGSRFDDEPMLEIDGNPVQITVDAELSVLVPSITIADQAVGEDGILMLDNVTLDRDAWLAVYVDDAGAIGEQIGLRYMEAGTLDNVAIPLQWRKGTPMLTLILHNDTDRLGRFDPDTSDQPILVRNQPVATLVDVTYPPIIDVLDQSLVNDTLHVERVVVNEPAWLAIWNDNGFGRPSRVIGFAPLDQGVNNFVGVEVVRSLVTDDLYAQIHIDVDDAGLFNFPGLDQPINIDGEIRPFKFTARSGNYVIASDQAIQYDGDQAAVIVDYAISDLDMFVVIRTDDNETPGIAGDVIGYTWVPGGINRNVIVEIADDALTPILHATLHIDQDAIRTFEYPNGGDFELKRNGTWIAVPFLAEP